MAPSSASLWLEHNRLLVQGGWFALFGVALWLSILAFYKPDSSSLFATARSLWALAMAGFVSMWIAGAVFEMVRRAAKISGMELVLALAAFSILLAGTLSLVREWFGLRWGDPLKCERVALSMGVLTLAGWWFGGMGLEWNALWNLMPQDYERVRAPDGWALALGGSALLGASRMVRSSDESRVRVKNPRAATWWILATALFVAAPGAGNNPPAASVFLLGAGAFLVKIWRSRNDRPIFLRVNRGTRSVLVLLLASLPLLVLPQDRGLWWERLLALWTSPLYLAGFIALCGLLAWLGLRVREPLRLAIFDAYPKRALLQGLLVGSLGAMLFFGPAGVLFWAFWPLAGLFFDLLAPRVSPNSQSAKLPAEVAAANTIPSGSADSFSH